MTNSQGNQPDHAPDPDLGQDPRGDNLSPLPGEFGIPDVAARKRSSVSKKGLLAAALLAGSLLTAAVLAVQRVPANGKKTDDTSLMRDKPTAATANPRKLEMPSMPTSGAAGAIAATEPRIPAIAPTDDELAEPIGVRRTGAAATVSSTPKSLLPEDAPVLLVTTRPGLPASPRPSIHRATETPPPDDETAWAVDLNPNGPIAATTSNLKSYQRQLQGLLDNLSKAATLATGQSQGTLQPGAGVHQQAGGMPATGLSIGGGLFGGQLQGSATPKVSAAMLGNRSLTLPKGAWFTCALKTKVISATSGLVGCQVQRNVFGDDGRVLLIERGSHLDGEYRIASVRPGTVRIPVLWTRIRTPLGVTVDLDSPGSGQLGESGLDGYVDNRWGERIGAAMLLSLIDDSVKLVIQDKANGRQADTIVLPSTTANTSKLAEKVLDSTINIPPLVYRNQGDIVGIYVARDIDFSSVYELQPTDIDLDREAQR